MMKHIVRSTMGLVLAGALVAGVAVAQEQTMLQASSPADGAALDAPPQQLELTFMHPVQLDLVTVSTLAGETIPVAVERTGEATTEYTVPLPELQPDDYTVQWQAVGDGHTMSGTIQFTVAGG
jgi:methionine-rich copper-binding protein CopC